MHDANGLLNPIGIFWLYALGSALLTLAAMAVALSLFFKGRRDVDVDSSGALQTPARDAAPEGRAPRDLVSALQLDLKRSLEHRRREAAEGRPSAARSHRRIPKSAA